MFAAAFVSPAFGAEQILLETKQVKITAKDFEADLSRIPMEQRSDVLASKQRIRKLLENLLISKTLAAQARSAGLDRDPDMRSQLEMAQEKLLAQEQINRTLKAVVLPDFEGRARELYLVNPTQHTLPAKVHASHILVDMKKRTKDEALARIQEVRALALSGKAFDELAQEYSDDPTAKTNKGDLRFFEPEKMVKPFSDAAFALEAPGDISQPVLTTFGYHIIRLHEKQSRRTLPFVEVKEKIIQELRDKYLADHRQVLLEGILSDSSMKLNEAAVDRFQTKIDVPSVEPKK